MLKVQATSLKEFSRLREVMTPEKQEDVKRDSHFQ